jgi:hypothetical protein
MLTHTSVVIIEVEESFSHFACEIAPLILCCCYCSVLGSILAFLYFKKKKKGDSYVMLLEGEKCV